MHRRTRHPGPRNLSYFERDIANYHAGSPDDRDAFLHVIRHASLKLLKDHVDLYLVEEDEAKQRGDQPAAQWASWRMSRTCNEIEERQNSGLEAAA